MRYPSDPLTHLLGTVQPGDQNLPGSPAGSPARGTAPVPVDAGRSGPPLHRRPELGVRRGKVAAVWAPDAREEA